MRSIYPLFIAALLFLSVVAMILTLVLPMYVNNNEVEAAVLDQNDVKFIVLATKQTMTLWKLKIQYNLINPATGSGSYTYDLIDYFDCQSGNTFVQGMKGFVFLVTVVNFCNFVVCIVHACLGNSHILRCPLRIFLIVALGCHVPVTGSLLLNFLKGWCGMQSLRAQGFFFNVGFYSIVASTLVTLISTFMSICV